PGFSDRLEDESVRDRGGNPESGRLGLGLRPRSGGFRPLLPGLHKRSASLRLHDPEPRPWTVVPTEIPQFLEGLPHPHDPGRAASAEPPLANRISDLAP